MKCPCAIWWRIPAIVLSKNFLLRCLFFQKSNFEKEHGELTLEPGGCTSAQVLCVSHPLCQESSARLSSFSALPVSDSAQTLPCKKDTLTVFEGVSVPHMTITLTPRLQTTLISIHSRINESWCLYTVIREEGMIGRYISGNESQRNHVQGARW